MNKGRIWPSSILILGLGAWSALSALSPTPGSCPFAGPAAAPASESQFMFRETSELLTARYGNALDRQAMGRGIGQAVRAELERSGKSTSMLGLMEMMYLPNQPEQFITSCATQLPANQLWDAATRGLLAGVGDERARVMSPEEMFAYRNLALLPMNGIGAVLSSETSNGLEIQRALPNHPAERAGIQAGDRIVAIDGESTLGMGLYTGMSRLRGLAGTEVAITVESVDGRRFDTTIVRERIQVGPSVTTTFEGGAPAIRVNYIDCLAPDQISASLDRLGSSAVLDLRDLSGSDITSAMRIASLFVPVNTLVGRMDSSVGEDHELRTSTPPQFEGQLTVLVNERTSGSAEILASCLKENGARLLGETTSGQASSLTMVPRPDGSALQLPSEIWYNASNEAIDGHGVEPSR